MAPAPATPVRRLTDAITAAPAAEANHATELTGPMSAPAAVVPWTTSASRTGKRLLEGDHREPAEQLHYEQRQQDA